MCKFVNNILVCSGKTAVIVLFGYWDLLMCLNDFEESETKQVKPTKMEKNIDCPLCLEPLELDDKNFFPCDCGYQVCRFCWHRIRTNENGLCPACRRMYPEDPANFEPLTPEELQKMKLQKKMKDQQKKQKIAENRKQLANIRVIQKNLVFAVGLPLELSQDNQKKEKVLQMFRQFGQTQKEAITDRTSYAGSQGPSACVYITYQKPEDAVRAVKALTDTKMEGRTIKVSLGTTKYCSNFLKSVHCPKTECLYLHELADEEASFTKEDIHLGKHLEYEQKLIEQTLQSISQNKMHSPSNETNRTNHIQNADDCSECSDDVTQNGSFYDSSEISELSPSSTSQNLENNRSIESDLNVETEHGYQCLPPYKHPNGTNYPFRPHNDTKFSVNNHTSNSNFQNASHGSPNSVNTHIINQMQQQKDIDSIQHSNYVPSPHFENILNREQQPSPSESTLLRIITSNNSENNDSKHSYTNLINYKQEYPQPESKKREDDPDLEFDPCQVSLNALEALVISEEKEKARIHYNALNTSPVCSKPATIPVHPSNNVVYRNLFGQPTKVREPPPGFSNNPQNMFKSAYDSGNSFVNKPASVPIQNHLGIRGMPQIQRFQQGGVTVNNSPSPFLNDFPASLSRDVPDIVPQVFHQHNQRFTHNPMNVTQVQPTHLEQRSTAPVWNNSNQSQWRPIENTVFNQSITENRAAGDFNLRLQQLRSNEPSIRQWQHLNGNMNNISPFSESQTPMNSEQLAKMQTFELLYKAFEAAQRSNELGHRLQYTKKL